MDYGSPFSRTHPNIDFFLINLVCAQEIQLGSCESDLGFHRKVPGGKEIDSKGFKKIPFYCGRSIRLRNYFDSHDFLRRRKNGAC